MALTQEEQDFLDTQDLTDNIVITKDPVITPKSKYVYSGNFELIKNNDKWEWSPDKHLFIVTDINNIQDSEIPNPFYRVAMEEAIIAGNHILTEYPNEYRLWNYIKSEFVNKDKKVNPLYLNFTDKGIMETRLQSKEWKVGGHLVQVIHYANFDLATQEYSIPVICERWYWVLDPITNLALSRTIEPHGYRNLDDSTDPANPIPVMLPLKQENVSIKYYPAGIKQFDEVIRRRQNVIDNLKEKVAGFLMYLVTGMDQGMAITLGQSYLHDVQLEIQIFVESGMEDLANITVDSGAGMPRANHTWLDTDLTPLGVPMPMYLYIEMLIREDSQEKLDAFDYNTLPNY